MWLTAQAAFAAAFLYILISYADIAYKQSRSRLPPGPRQLPLIGNILQVPLEYQERVFAQWSRQYGDVVYARLFRTPTIILGTLQTARDLMDKRSAKYSGRPRSVMLKEMLDWDRLMVVLDYGDLWRKHRKWIQGSFNDKASLLAWQVVQRREVCVLLSLLLSKPESFLQHLKRYSAALIMETVYGHTVTSDNDEYVAVIEEAMKGTVESGTAGATPVDFFPILKYVPSWMPGAQYKRQALHVRRLVQEANNKPFEMVKRLMTLGRAKPSVVSSLLEASTRAGTLTEDELDIKGAGGALYGPGTDTTNSVMTTFFLAMVLHPEVLKKAQEEIDQVVGAERLPDFPDREKLPYVECVVKEVYRWICPLPLGIPHRVTENDGYLGYEVPKGAMIIPNIWSMSMNAEIYPEPAQFRPERFLDMNPNLVDFADPRGYVFGFGRRICPGRQFADASVWLVIASVVATFNIRTAKDIMGNELVPEASYDSGIVSHPHPFACSIMPRSSRSIATVMEAKSALDA
ncbi:cytochrome P450 [Wolfiporia cocos MD-104 SS10]|uniref:Cytochrome P450 n=1 Tax=Wolfiporia cocos (strain MD-104) TaxID=742152 RepID=A0A2H3JMY6_WOLCO|nr:cytochrome P450 [Wolfiporia cocos MD-104 SS10]